VSLADKIMTLIEDAKEACRACIDVKSWFKTSTTAMKSSATIATALLYKDPQVEQPTELKTSSAGLLCPPDARELGRATWTFLHATAAYLPSERLHAEQRKRLHGLLAAVASFYPCTNCAEHMTAYMEANPPDLTNRHTVSTWLCNFHNEINAMLGKAVFDCAQLDERWRKGPGDTSCN